MIWTDFLNRTESADTLERYVRDEIHRALPLEEGVADDVARGVAAYWREQFDREMVPADYIAHMIACALRGVGEMDAADRMAGANDHRRPIRHLSLDLWRLLTSRVYRPQAWAGDEPLWVLDLTKLSGLDPDILELAWFPVLRILLTGMAELWDETRGRAALGLRSRPPAGLGGKAQQGWRNEVVRFGEAVLARLGPARNWQSLPRLVLLDDATGRAKG